MERPLFLYTWYNALVMFTEASLLFAYRSMVDEIKEVNNCTVYLVNMIGEMQTSHQSVYPVLLSIYLVNIPS